jgi:hypothetical protein
VVHACMHVKHKLVYALSIGVLCLGVSALEQQQYVLALPRSVGAYR